MGSKIAKGTPQIKTIKISPIFDNDAVRLYTTELGRDEAIVPASLFKRRPRKMIVNEA